MATLGQDHKIDEWNLADSSKCTLKTVLHSGNKHPFIPTAYAVHMKETYKNTEILLDKINYDKHCWNICDDLKVVPNLLAMQFGCMLYLRMG
jgi:hypothetical protein